MDAFRRLVFIAVLAGLAAGGLVTLIQHFGTTAIIARAETYERAGGLAAAGGAAHGDHGPAAADGGHGPSASAWEPQDGLERTSYTALGNMLTAIAFSLLLAAGMGMQDGEADWRTGLLWGLAGFASFTVAPGVGLPPELPGTAAAPVLARQVWWAATAAATAGGLALLLLQRRPLWALAGVVLLAAPHLHGAPQPAEYGSAAPEALARQFVATATVTSFVFWAALGSLTGFFASAAGRGFFAGLMARRARA